MAKNKNLKEYFSPLLIGHFFLMANIGLNIFIRHQTDEGFLRTTGLIFMVPAIILWLLPVMTLRKYGEISSSGSFLATTQLVEKGIYKLIRHPQYLSFMLLSAGLALINQDVITTVISIFTIGFMFAGIKEEEKLLINQFDNDYSDYMKRVPSINIFRGLFRLCKR